MFVCVCVHEYAHVFAQQFLCVQQFWVKESLGVIQNLETSLKGLIVLICYEALLLYVLIDYCRLKKW